MFEEKGFCVISDFLSKKEVDEINKEITQVKNADIYYDSNGKLRRVERLYDKGKYLKIANKRCIKLLEKKLNQKISIFKD